ncbi:Lrp/AsnC family transcriptional regulator [Marinibaculum pumilum]|uniref:Lrp/AsnC family transcriptional regulator n=1 Tax=Marinibaculum pumilum TaxID=1766165 RepID=A0ABV7KTV9_9PROT
MIELDAIDLKILRELQGAARISNRELADRVGLSPSPCWSRVRRLEREGVIAGYVTVFDQAALGRPDTVVVEVTLDRHDDDMLDRFGAALADLPEVIEAHLVTGDYDYLVIAAVAGTEGYERFLRERLYRIPGIRHSRSSFSLRCLKRSFSVGPA